MRRTRQQSFASLSSLQGTRSDIDNLPESNPNEPLPPQQGNQPNDADAPLPTTPGTTPPKRGRRRSTINQTATTTVTMMPTTAISTTPTTPLSSPRPPVTKRARRAIFAHTNGDDKDAAVAARHSTTAPPVPVTPDVTIVGRRQQRKVSVEPSSPVAPVRSSRSRTTSTSSPTPEHVASTNQNTTRPTPTSKQKKATTKEASSTINTSDIKKKSKKISQKIYQRAPPNDWQSIYQLVEELRADRTAPVDTNGSEALPQKHLGPATFRFQVLIALMLSSQTKDMVVGDAMRTLQAHGLTLDNIRRCTTYETLNQMIVKVGFHNTKAKNILQVAEILHAQFDDDIPTTAQEMINELPGVGPKMAFIVENVAWGRTTGIGVDTHMHRMFNQLRWVNSTQPEQTRLQLESWLPADYWPTVNVLWVGMGQEVQQFQDKLLRKCLDCTKPQEALKLVHRLGLDYRKVGTKMGCMTEIETVLQSSSLSIADTKAN